MSVSSRAIADTITGFDETEALLNKVMAAVHGGWTPEYFWEISAFALAAVLAWYLSVRFNSWLHGFDTESRKQLSERVKHYSINVAVHLSFSLIAASLLWLMVWALREWGLVGKKNLIFAELGYMAFYAFALLRILIYMLQGMLGKGVVTPTIAKLVGWVFWILVALEFVGILPLAVSFMKSQNLPIGSQDLTLWTMFTGGLSALLTLGVANWIANVLEGIFKRSAGLAPNLQVVLSRVCRWVLMACALLIALSSVGIDLTVLSVFGGAVGVGLGFGLQKITSNYISGFIILLDHSIKIGDFIEIGGFRGKVTEINTRYTVVCDWNGIENIVPNENFVTGAVKNYYHSENACIALMRISVAYGSDVRRALEIFREESNKPDRVIKTRRGWTGITNLGDSAINLESGVWVPNIGDGTVSLRTEVLINTLKRYQDEGIEVPFPQLDIRVREDRESAAIEDLAKAIIQAEDMRETKQQNDAKVATEAAGNIA